MRGFTGHQHADNVRLIHMNGRIYDYQLGRFLSVDPIIQFPANSQSLNPYSYILNNPLSGRDPSGYEACGDVSADQTNVSGSCDVMGANGKTVSVGYSFNANGDVGLSVGGNTSAASAAVSVGVMANNGADATGPKGPSSLSVSGIAADIGAIKDTLGQQASAMATGAVRSMFPETAKLSDQGGVSGPLTANDARGSVVGAFNTVARAANDLLSLAAFLRNSIHNKDFVDYEAYDIYPVFSVPPEMQRGTAIGEVVFATASMCVAPQRLSVTVAGEWSAIGSTGKIGEDALRAMGGKSQQFFRTPMGGRFVDQFVGGMANESKVGYQALTRSNALQIQKDAWLIQNNQKVDGAAWRFYESPVTGRSGPSASLRDALNRAGINIFEK